MSSSIALLNPATETLILDQPLATAADADAAIAVAVVAVGVPFVLMGNSMTEGCDRVLTCGDAGFERSSNRAVRPATDP